MSPWQHWLAMARAKARNFLGLTPPKPKSLIRKPGVTEVTMLRHHIQLPPEPTIDDLDHREATIKIGDTEPTVLSISKGSTEFTVDTDRNVSVTISLVDVDTSGNKSAPSDPLTFTATDTVPPPQPGTLAVASVEQV